jgi:hypothetical protein
MALGSTQSRTWISGIVLEMKGGLRLKITVSPPSMSQLSKIVEAWSYDNPIASTTYCKDIFTLSYMLSTYKCVYDGLQLIIFLL